MTIKKTNINLKYLILSNKLFDKPVKDGSMWTFIIDFSGIKFVTLYTLRMPKQKKDIRFNQISMSRQGCGVTSNSEYGIVRVCVPINLFF